MLDRSLGSDWFLEKLKLLKLLCDGNLNIGIL